MAERTSTQQLRILRQLSRGLASTSELRIAGSTTPSVRRSLALLRNRGLVSQLGVAMAIKGQPAIWEITSAGVEFLAQRDTSSRGS